MAAAAEAAEAQSAASDMARGTGAVLELAAVLHIASDLAQALAADYEPAAGKAITDKAADVQTTNCAPVATAQADVAVLPRSAAEHDVAASSQASGVAGKRQISVDELDAARPSDSEVAIELAVVSGLHLAEGGPSAVGPTADDAAEAQAASAMASAEVQAGTELAENQTAVATDRCVSAAVSLCEPQI